jgi:hypothetical protein
VVRDVVLRTRWIAIVAFLLVAVIGGLSWASRRRVYRTVAEGEAMLDAAGVAPGMSSGRLLAILDSLGVRHSAVSADGKAGARLGRTFEEFMGHGDLLADFTFDSAGRLCTRHAREVLTGP